MGIKSNLLYGSVNFEDFLTAEFLDFGYLHLSSEINQHFGALNSTIVHGLYILAK